MMNPRYEKRFFLAMALGLLAPWASVHAQGYPTRPIQLVIPFPPGGATDIAGRLVAKKLAERLGQPVVIDNRPGAGTVVGAAFVAKAAPDGYTLLISSGSTFTVNPALMPKLPYDPIKSFEPVGMVARVPLVLLANADVPINDLKQLITAVRAAPDKYMYGSFGNGTTGHFAGEMLWSATGIKLQHIAYKGSAPAALPQLKAAKPRIKAIAVTGESRATQMPTVATVAESGFKGFSADSWLAIATPKGVPADVKAKLQKALAETMKDPELREKLVANGLEYAWEPAAAVAARIENELPRMRVIALRSNIRID